MLPLYHKAHGLSTTSSAVATDSTDSTDSAVLADDKGLGEAPPEKIVLPTNESSERLLRIRHTVIFYLLIYLFVFLSRDSVWLLRA